MNIINLLSTNIFRYFSLGVFSKILAFIGVIFFSHALTPGEFGTVAIFLSVVLIVSSLLSFGVGQMVVREKALMESNDFAELVYSSAVLAFFILVVLVFVFTFLDFFYDRWLLPSSLMFLAFFTAYFFAFIEIVLKVFVVKDSIQYFSFAELFKNLTPLCLSISLIFLFSDYALESRVIGYVLGLTLTFLFVFYLLKNSIKPIKISFEKGIMVLKYGLNVLPQIVSNWIKMGADKLLLVPFLSLDEIGSYSYTLAICSAAMLFGTALNNSYASKCIDLYYKKKLFLLKRLRSNYIFFMTLFVIMLSIFLFFLKPFIWPEDYLVSNLIIFIFLVSFIFQLLYLLYAKYFLYALKIKILSYINFMFTALYVLLLWLFSDNLTILKSAIILCLHSFFIFSWVFLYAVYHEKKEFSLRGM